MIELGLVFVSGVLGSSHCIGMCGPFALALGAYQTHWKRNLVRQLLYSVGRIFTYAFLGACAGFGGQALVLQSPALARAPAVLAVLAGVLLIVQGCFTAGWLRLPHWGGSTGACPASSMFAGLMRQPGAAGVFLAGLFTGFLPCGLVYAFLAMAASSVSLLGGVLIMVAFGLGTVPVMVMTGVGGSLLSGAWRVKLIRLAACAVLLAGCASLVRGYQFWQAPDPTDAKACPFCAPQ